MAIANALSSRAIAIGKWKLVRGWRIDERNKREASNDEQEEKGNQAKGKAEAGSCEDEGGGRQDCGP